MFTLRSFALPVLVVTLAVAGPSWAEKMMHDSPHGSSVPVAGETAAMSSGTVKKVDPANGKITISHGPLENLGMPAMTMVFRVSDSAMLEQVKIGDKVRFVAEKVDGSFTVTKLESAN